MEKLEELKEYLSGVSLSDILEVESNDPQYRALEMLSRNIDSLLFFKLVVVNALLSYQLPMKGEVYWQKFAEFFSKKRDISFFEEFLKRYNYRILNGKIKRLRKAQVLADFLFPDIETVKFYGKDLKKLLDDISQGMNQSKDAKTVVFAVKMFIYAYRIAFGEAIFAPFGIMIPLDSRIKKISQDKNFWRKLEKEVNIPLLHIDAVLWLK